MPGSDGLIGWDAQLCRLGAAIRHRRVQSLVQLEPDFTRFYRRFSTGREEVGVTYRAQTVAAVRDTESPAHAPPAAGPNPGLNVVKRI